MSLKQIVIPNKVTDIGIKAFDNCKKLEWMVIPSSVTSIGNSGLPTNTTVYCKANSAAETYAKVNKINYVSDDIKATPKLSITEPTNKDITVTITKKYTESTTENVAITDLLGDNTTASVKITNIDKEAPKVKVSYSTTTLTNQNVTVTITADKELQSISGWTLSTDKKTLTKEYAANTPAAGEVITVKDLAGNTETVNVKVTNIDKVAPTTNVSYSSTTATNQSVKVTITANEKIKQVEGWTISADQKTLTKTYTVNQKETITITDLAGNTTKVNISVTNIDKTEISATVKYSTTLITNKNVDVTITANKKVKQISGWTISTDGKTLTKTFENNSQETITLQDEAGNTKKVEINVENIDKVKPIIEEIKYSIEELTNQNVKVTITTNKIMQEIEGWTLSEDKKTLTKEYTENTSAEGEKIDIKDLAGNSPEKDVIVKITNIDKTRPELQIKYSTTSETTEGVIVTITSNKEIQPVDGWELSEDKKSLTKTYSANQEEEISIYDLAGNESKINIEIKNITDKSTIDKNNDNGNPNTSDKNTDKTLEQEGAQKDGTLATEVIPKAGNKCIVIILIAGIVLAAIFGIKNRKFKDIK